MRRLGFLFLGLCAMTFAPQAQADLWISGHGDIGAHFHGGEFELHFHFEDGAMSSSGPIPSGEHEPDAYQIAVAGPPIARPSGAQWDFLGAPAGADIWFLPQESDPNKPYLGLGLEDLDPAEWSGDLTWQLVGFSGPGQFALFQTTFAGLKPYMSTANGLDGSDIFLQSAGGHEHLNWSFTSQGVYELQFQISGTHNTLGFLSDTATFSFISGVPEPSSMALLSCAGIGMAAGWVRRIRKAKSAT